MPIPLLAVLVTTYVVTGLVVRRYTWAVRLLLLGVTVLASAWFYLIW